MKALLLRVGIDKGTDRALAPIFADGKFEYIPMSETAPSKETRTFGNTTGRSGHLLSSFLPEGLTNNIIHFDPEFETFTYGDPTSKRNYLLKLQEDDLLVFYAGLTPYNNENYKEALYIIGYFTVKEIVDFNKLSGAQMEEAYRQYNNNAHIKRVDNPTDVVIVVGKEKQSKRLRKAILISQTSHDSKGRKIHIVSDEMTALLGISGSIQRSIPPRFIRQKEKINNLKNLLG